MDGLSAFNQVYQIVTVYRAAQTNYFDSSSSGGGLFDAKVASHALKACTSMAS